MSIEKFDNMVKTTIFGRVSISGHELAIGIFTDLFLQYRVIPHKGNPPQSKVYSLGNEKVNWLPFAGVLETHSRP
jgi:hypothetical protein